MRKLFTNLLKLLLLALVIAGFGVLNSYSQEYKSGVLQGTIRIKVKPTIASAMKIGKNSSKGIVTTGIQSLDNLNTTYSVTEMKRVFPYSPKFEEKHKKYGLDLWYDVTIISKASSSEVVKNYSQLPEIEKAEPILEKILIDGSTKPIYLSKSEKGSGSEYFNDPYLFKQWHYNNTGQTGGTPGSDINAYKAWDITKGSKNVIVSIHDQGVDVDHEDLKDAMWVNEAELNGVTGVDDDGNGYKDDVYGFNFASNMGKIDAMFHGTHVAGTIGAVNNNGIGVAGVAGGSGSGDGVRIMSCQILGGTGFGNTPDSYVYAADMGALISQNSWGYSDAYAYEQSVLDAIDYFIAEAGSYAGSPMKGGVVIFAAGNSAWEYPSYPGYYSSCISVAALNASNHLTVYSNYGTWVDLAAPGGQSEDNANIDPNSEYKNGVLSTLDNDAYGFMDGTSMACPHVSGVAALVVSKYGGSTFSSSDLKNRLLTGTRLLDTIPANEMYKDKMGTGAIDAALALATNTLIAPNKINDLALVGIAQDFGKVKWTVPADVDDAKPVGFEVSYSTQEITMTNIQSAKQIKLNSRLEPGSSDSVEISNLKPLTKYYFVVRSVDRWGNKSELSNQVNGTTNAGPDAQIDPNSSSLDFVIDVTQNSQQALTFDLLNNGEGLLKWDAFTHHINAYPNSLKQVKYPKIESSHYSNGKSLSSSQAKEALHPTTFAIDNPTYDEMTYLNLNSWNLWVIGETDTTFTNSSATRFLVSNTEGFNLTNIEAFLRHKESTGPVILEVYEGMQIDNARMVYRQEVNYTSDYGYTPISLEERIFFEKDKYFWIVFHVPSMNKYPLGAGLESNKEDSKNCYYSTDLGKTWAGFEDVYFDNQLVWAVVAISKYESTDQYITLSPTSGSVTANSSTTIGAAVDATNMINGNYSARIAINTNETDEPLLRLPVTLSISGHKPVIKSIKRIDAGGVLVGGEKSFEIKMQNTGLGQFKFESYGYDANWNSIYFDISNSQFTYGSGLNSYFDAKTEQTLKFKFKPTQTGNITAKVSIKDDKGNSYSFELFGYGIDPPVLSISPAQNTFSGLAIGDTLKGQFNISNTGNYPLDYYAPAFADGSNMAEVPANTHKFGYTYATNPEGLNPSPAFTWTDISSTGTDISSRLDDDFSKRFTQVDIGFEFPFFGKNETSIYIWRYSILSFDTEGYPWSRTPLAFKWEGLPDRLISVTGYSTDVENGGHIYYQRFVDKFIVQWENVPIAGAGRGTYQAVLHDNGNINIYINELTPDGWATTETLALSAYIGIEDQVKNDGLLVHDIDNPANSVITNGTAIEFVSPGQGLFTTLTNPFGTVQPGESVTLEYTINTDSLYVAQYAEKLVVVSNDPVNNPGLHSTNFEISTGGTPKVTKSATDLDFGKVFKTDTKKETFFIGNTGKAPLTMLSANFTNGNFSIDGSFPQVLKPGKSLIYAISINSSNLGNLSDVLTITTDEPATYQINLSGVIIDAPEISINIADITETIESGESKTVSFKVSNSGNHDLEFAPVGNSWMNILEKITKKVPSIPGYTYQFKSSTDASGPSYEWIEIAKPENKITVGDPWANENPWSAKIDLPFTFNFYGTEYNYIYVGFNGLVGFVPVQTLDIFGGIAIPNVDVPNNFIAALYGFIGNSGTDEYPNTGHYIYTDSDKAIVEYCDFNTGFGMSGPMSIQIILYKTGNIKFQYKMHHEGDADVISPWGVIGVENPDGTEGVQIANRTFVNRNKMAYELFPVKKYTIPSLGNKEFNVVLTAKDLYAGQYTDELKMINNVPLSQNLSIPVSLTVNGAAEFIAPDSVGFGDIMVIETPDSWTSPYKTYEKEFAIENKGTSKIEILSFDLSKINSSKVFAYMRGTDWFGNPIWQWTDVTNLPEMDWNTWLPIPLYLQPKSVMKYKVETAPISANQVRDTLTVVTDLGSYPIAIAADAYLPPVIDVVMDTIRVYAQTSTHFETKSLVINNTNGGYDLHYNLEIDYKRASENVATTSNLSNKTVGEILPLKAYRIENKLKNSKGTNSTYNRTIAYESATQAETNLGYGGSSAFYTSTAFKAPADGFNLTDVQTWYAAGTWLDSKIKVQIYSGSNDIFSAKLVHSQIFEYKIAQPNQTGELITIHLDKNVLIYPNEDFFVTFGYESGAAYSQGVVTMPNIVKNRYLYGNGSGNWYDISDAGPNLESFGWMVRALEANFQSAAWVSLNSSATDTIAVGSTKEIKVDFKAGYAKLGENTAKLVITSNDPLSSKKYVTLILDLNQGPKFEIEKTALSVDENEVLKFKVVAKDIEGDNITMSMLSRQDFVKGVFANDTVEITCSPNYSDAGIYTIKVEAADAFGNKSLSSILLTVQNVNRAPVVINPIGDKGIGSTQMPNFLLSSIISDPDGDRLNYTVTSSNEDIVKLFMAADEVLFTSKAAGSTTITITGTDPGGLSISHSFVLTVFQTGIEDNLAGDIKLYPNPTNGSLYLILPSKADKETTIRVTNVIGTVLVEKKFDFGSSQIKLDVSGFTNGVYFVHVVGSGFEKTIKVIKN